MEQMTIEELCALETKIRSYVIDLRNNINKTGFCNSVEYIIHESIDQNNLKQYQTFGTWDGYCNRTFIIRSIGFHESHIFFTMFEKESNGIFRSDNWNSTKHSLSNASFPVQYYCSQYLNKLLDLAIDRNKEIGVALNLLKEE